MRNKKSKPVQTFPVMDGAGSAPRADQIAGIVQRVWADSTGVPRGRGNASPRVVGR